MPRHSDLAFGGAEYWTWDAPMWDHLRSLRENDPIHWSEADQLFVLSRFEEVAFVSKHHPIFCSGQGVLPGNAARLSLIDEDEPRHTELRRLINKGFTPRRVEALEPAFRQITREAIDAVARQGRCDFVVDLAVPLPLMLIAEMLGIRAEDRDLFHGWSDAMILAQGGSPDAFARAGAAFSEFAEYVGEIFEDRRKAPRDDLMSILVGAKQDGILVHHDGDGDDPMGLGRSADEIELGNDELIMFCVLLLVAGNETTRNGLTGAMSLLIEHPGAREALIQDPTRIPAAVEELLRLTSPVLSFVRTATCDTELEGTAIGEGQRVLMLYPSANRDASVFAEPDRLDLDRRPHHLAFGLGNHFCLGANLARMELRVALEELLARLPDMAYADGGPRMAPSALVRSFEHMQVSFTPEA